MEFKFDGRMNFPPKMENGRRLQISASRSKIGAGVKISSLIHRHEQVKTAYHQLKSQIQIGLVEAEEVFASLAIPLMKLVGLKSEEMAEEGRFSTIFIDPEFSHGYRSDGAGSDQSQVISGSPFTDEGEEDQSIRRNHGQVEEESCAAAKAVVASMMFIEKQQGQLIDLVHLLKQIENQVNSHQDDILDNLSSHRTSLHKLFRKSVYGLSALHKQKRGGDTSLTVTVNLLQATFEYMGMVLNSVEEGVQGLMHDLAQHMCAPMVEYVNGKKADLKNGTCAQLLVVVREMEASMRNGRVELNEARKRVRVAEQGKVEALCKLKEMEERVKRMKEYHSFTSLDTKQQGFVPSKSLVMEEREALGMVRRSQRAEVSPGTKEIMCFDANYKNHKSIRVRPKMNQRSQFPGPDQESPRFNALIPMGASRSATFQQLVSRNKFSS